MLTENKQGFWTAVLKANRNGRKGITRKPFLLSKLCKELYMQRIFQELRMLQWLI